MEPMLILVLWVLFAIGLGWLVYWGGGQMGMPPVPRMIIAGFVFVLILFFALQRAGMLNL